MLTVTTFFSESSLFLSNVTAYIPPLTESLLSRSVSEKIIVMLIIIFCHAYSWKQDFLGFKGVFCNVCYFVCFYFYSTLFFNS